MPHDSCPTSSISSLIFFFFFEEGKREREGKRSKKKEKKKGMRVHVQLMKSQLGVIHSLILQSFTGKI